MTRQRLAFDAGKIYREMQLRGWNQSDLARVAGVSKMTVARFLQGNVQTAKVAGKLAAALGHELERYVVAPALEAQS